MKIVQPWHRIETELDGEAIIRHIEKCARTCYKSEHKISGLDNAEKFIRSLIKRGHESAIEHFNITVRFLTSRGVTHELVRHRLVSYSQESTRYCSYGDERFGSEIRIVDPFIGNNNPYEIINITDTDKLNYGLWESACNAAEKIYLSLLDNGCPPQIARSVLPNCLATEIVATANLREWRKIFELRTAPAAHPEMRALMIPLLEDFNSLIPVIFEDLINKL